jgi:TNF receptor-associated protein 1
LDINALIYIPSSNPETMGSPPQHLEVSLYSKRVLIKQNSTELFPKWMRFVKGVVDCADISLNVSRETAQDTSMMNKIRDILTNRTLRLLKAELDKDESR